MELPVEKLLKEKGIRYRLIELSQKAYTVEDVVKYSGGDIDPKEICKTIVLKGKKTGGKWAVLLRGEDRLDFSKAKEIFREALSIAGTEEVKEVGGVEPGAVCPFLLQVPLYVDRRVLELEKINCGSGNLLYGIEFRVEDLGRVVGYQVVDVAHRT